MFENRDKPEIISSLFFILFAILGFILIPSQIPPLTKAWGVMQTLPGGHKLFPIISLALIGVCGLFLILREFTHKESVTKSKGNERKDEGDFKAFWVTAVAWGLYAVGVQYIGYLVSTFTLLLFLFRYYGITDWKKMIIVDLFIVFFVYLVFVRLMRLPFSFQALLF